MDEYEQAAGLIRANPARARFAGPRPGHLVVAAEAVLGIRLPQVYRRFVLDFGAGNFGSAEFYGVIDDDFDNSCTPDGVWFTRSEWVAGHLPRGVIVVGSTGDGDLYCLDTREGKEPPVSIWRPGPRASMIDTVARDFGEHLLERVRAQVPRP